MENQNYNIPSIPELFAASKTLITLKFVHLFAPNLKGYIFELPDYEFLKIVNITQRTVELSTMFWSDIEKAFCVKTYIENQHSVKAVQTCFCKEFGRDSRKKDSTPSARSIHYWYKQFTEKGCLSVSHERKHKVLTKPTRSDENIDIVNRSVDEAPKKSIRRRSSELKISKSSLQRILKQDLHLKPYHISVHQGITTANKEKRTAMCQWFIMRVRQDNAFLKNVWFSDEAHFYCSGNVNARNNIHWASRKPDNVIQPDLHSKKATAWVALSSQGIIGPFWFCDENGETLTVTADRYLGMLSRFDTDLRSFCDHGAMQNQWFMQDGAAPHTARRVLSWLQEHFQDRVIGRLTSNEWAPHSPDLNPLDFFLWGYIKDQIQGETFADVEMLKRRVDQLIKATPKTMCERAVEHFASRVKMCADRNGYFEHLF